MTLTVSTRSPAGFQSTAAIRSFSIDIDPTGEDAPDTLESLLASYGACYVPALRVAADKHDGPDLGAVDIEVTGRLNEDDKLAGVSFSITTDGGLDAATAADVVRSANALCKVHDALRSDLEANITLDGHHVE